MEKKSKYMRRRTNLSSKMLNAVVNSKIFYKKNM